MWSRVILTSFALTLTFLGNDAFSDRNLISIRSFVQPPTSYQAPSRPKILNSWSTERRKHRRFYREHKALSVPFSGPRVDPRDPSWENVLVPRGVGENQHTGVTIKDKAAIIGTLAAVASALCILMTVNPPGSWRFFAAGGICAATSHAIPTPIDVVKTRKQVDSTLSDKSFAKAAHQIAKTEGMSALWAGLGPTAWGYLLEGAVKFGVYEILKPVVKSTLTRMASYTSVAMFQSQILAFILCGAASGLAASLMLCPMEAIRIRMVAEPTFANGGWMQAGYKMVKQEGASSFSKGITPMIMKQVPYTVTKNVSFDIITRSFYAFWRAQGMAITGTTMFAVPLASAALASVLSTVSSQPGDMLLSLVNAHQGDRKPLEIFKSILNSDRGISGLFVGFKTRLLHVGVTVTLQLMIYDYVKRLCGIAATGSC